MLEQYAIIFPGQGSQSVGMLAQAAEVHPVILDVFSRASNILGYDLWSLVQQGPAEQLNQTIYTQPALFVADVALYYVWIEKNKINPQVMAGHSLGEYSALCAADVISFEDGVRLVAARGQYMQEAVQPGFGAMAAIVGFEKDAEVDAICREVAEGQVLSPANYNSHGQVVIAGETDAVNRAIIRAKEKGAKLAKLIPVSVPSHCLLMQSAQNRLAALLNTINMRVAKVPVIQNYDVMMHDDPSAIRDALIAQLTQPVRWVETVQKIVGMGITEMLECGPGNVLSGLNKRIEKEVMTYAVG